MSHPSDPPSAPRALVAAAAGDVPDDATAELQRLRAILATMSCRGRPRAPCPPPRLPFDALPPIPTETRRALEIAVLESNDRYLDTFLEPHSFCPFSRGGRQRAQTLRLVHYADTADFAPFLARIHEAARDPSKLVIQVIVPMIEVSAEAWIRFCHEATAAGNEVLRAGVGGGHDVFAVAPLHPALRYTTTNPFALIPLFRRTPDPTIQWVRLDAIERLYAGRTGDTEYVDPDHVAAFLARPRRNPLFERIAQTNMKMAQRLGIPEVERTLRELARTAQERYARVLLDDAVRVVASPGRCPHRPAPASDTSPPQPALFERDGRWALARVSELEPRVPRRFVAAEVEVVAVRIGDTIHVLHGRCPHRNAPLTDAVVEEDRLVCPHHGWDFQLASGRSEGVPGASVARFREWTDDGLLWVDDAELRAWRTTQVPVFQPGDDVL